MLAVHQAPPGERPSSRPAAPPPAPATSFAALLQRGPATHGVLARPIAPMQPPPLRADAAARNGMERDRNDDPPTEAQRAARATAAKLGVKPVVGREKAPAASLDKPAAADSGSATADAARDSTRPAGPASDAATPSAVQAADLRDLSAALKLQLQQASTADLAGQDSPSGPGLDPGASAAEAVALKAGADADGSGGTSTDANDAGSTGAVAAAAVGRGGTAFATGLIAGSGERRAAAADTPTPHDAAAPLLSGAGGAVPRGFDPGTLAPIALTAPLHAPDFAQALGAQVSLLARDGVQQAELHLNPAEMGPISVQIELDGKLARVDFSAETAVTREVIERGLPELAAALREQGMTLSGGGVFQRPPDHNEQRRELPNGNRSKRAGAAAVEGVTTQAARLPAALGLVDLYA